jgi:hypothetical protein
MKQKTLSEEDKENFPFTDSFLKELLNDILQGTGNMSPS